MTIVYITALAIAAIAIITDHLQKQTKLKHKILQDQIELERLKHENFLIETDKMRLELEKIQEENSKDQLKIK